MRWRTSAVAALVAVGTAAAGLAIEESPVRATTGSFGQNEIKIVDVPGYPSWLTFDRSEDLVSLQNETDLGVQFDEYGAAAGQQQLLDPDRRFVASNEMGESATRRMAADPQMITVGDLDGNGSPEVVSLDLDNDLVVSPNLDDGLYDNAGSSSRRRNVTADIPSGAGPIMAIGMVDGMSTPANNRIFLVTEDGYLLLFKASATSGLVREAQTKKLALGALSSEKVLDAAADSVLDREVRGPASHRAGAIGVLTVQPDAGRARVFEVAVDPATGTFTHTNPTVVMHVDAHRTLVGARGRLETDFVDQNQFGSAPLVGHAALVTHGSNGESSFLATSVDGFLDGPQVTTEYDLCDSDESDRAPQLDFDLVPGTFPSRGGQIATCAGISPNRGAAGERLVGVNQLTAPFKDPSDPFDPFVDVTYEEYPAGTTADGSLRVSALSVDLPCDWLLLDPPFNASMGQLDGSCSSGTARGLVTTTGSPSTLDHKYTEFPPRTSTFVHLETAAGENRVVVGSGRNGTPSSPPSLRTLRSYSAANPPGQVVPLPPVTNRVKVQLNNPNGPQRIELDPLPLVVLQAPPFVRGAGQVPLAGPTYNTRQSSGGGAGQHTSNSVSLSIGIDIEDPTGAVGFNASVAVGSEAGTEINESIEVTSAEQFVGDPQDDTIIYLARAVSRYHGVVVESTNGVGLGEPMFIDEPRHNLITSATLTSLKARFRGTGLFDGGMNDKGQLSRILRSTPGNPSTYVRWGNESEETSSSVGAYCDNAAFDSSAPVADEIPDYPWGVQDNPFAVPDLKARSLRGPGILASARHHVQSGQGTSEGAGFSITNSTEESRISSMSVSAEVGAKGAYVTMGYGAEHTWGTSQTSSLAQGVDFLGYVGHLPSSLPDEEYDYRNFLCKKQLGPSDGERNGVPVWVFGWTVDGYNGSGGLEELADVAIQSPKQSQTVTTTPSFHWNQASGSVKDYDVELEAVGREDHRSMEGLFPVDSATGATHRNLDVTKTLAELGETNPLLTNQLYRWRVTARDWFDSTTTSDWEFFTTEGPVKNPTIDDPGTVAVNTFTDFTLRHEDVGGPYTYRWETGDGRVFQNTNPPNITGPVLKTLYPTPGVYELKATVTNAYGPSTATRTIIVGPQANPETVTIDEDTAVPAGTNVLSNDPGGDFVRLAPNSGPFHAKSFHLNLDGTFTYEPVDDYCSTGGDPAKPHDEFTYGVRGGTVIKNAKATIAIRCVNDAPALPGPVDYTVNEDDTLAPATDASSVLAGVTDPDMAKADIDPGVTHTAERVAGSGPAHGTLDLAADGTFTYVPNANYCNSNGSGTYDTFQVRAVDKGTPVLKSSPATLVRIRVTCENDAPKVKDLPTPALADKYEATEDTSLTVSAADGLKNGWSDVDTGATSGNDTADASPTFVSTTPGGLTSKGGSVAIEPADGSFTYEPAANYCTREGEPADTFTYAAVDSHGSYSSPSATVTIPVACVNDRPTAQARSYTATEDTALDTAAATPPEGLLVGASDVDGDTLAVTIDTQPRHGSVQLGADGNFRYTPEANYCNGNATPPAPDSFTYSVGDGNGGDVGPLTAPITVACVNDPPTPGADTYDAVDGQTLVVPARGVLSNDTDVDGDALAAVPHTASTAGGPVELSADGRLTFTPRPGFHGAVTQAYTVTDPHGATAVGQVTFNVRARTSLIATRATRSGNQATVSATLRAIGDGAPAVGATLRFLLNDGSSFCTATTDANGVAACTAPVPNLIVGLLGRYEVVFVGNAEYLPSKSASTPFGSLTG